MDMRPEEQPTAPSGEAQTERIDAETIGAATEPTPSDSPSSRVVGPREHYETDAEANARIKAQCEARRGVAPSSDARSHGPTSTEPSEWTADQVADALDRLAQSEWPSDGARVAITAAARLRAAPVLSDEEATPPCEPEQFYYVRECRGHWHVAFGEDSGYGGDLLGEHATREGAESRATRMNANRAAALLCEDSDPTPPPADTD